MKPENEAICIFVTWLQASLQSQQEHAELLCESMTDLFYLDRFVSQKRNYAYSSAG